MQKGEYSIATDDGETLFFRYWQSEGAEICLCILHGWGMHSGLYNSLAQYFTKQQVHVTAIDLRGHGLSNGKARQVKKMSEFDKEVSALLHESEKLFPHTKKIILGHQVGALLALQHYLLHKNIDALILSAPFFRPVNKISTRQWLLLRLLTLFFPFFSVDVVRYFGFSTLSSTDTGTHVPAMHVRLLYEIKEKGQKMITQGYRINIPILLMHGTNDNISLHKSSVVFARNTGVYTTFKSWQGKDHYLTEKNDPQVFEYMLQWIKQKVQASKV